MSSPTISHFLIETSERLENRPAILISKKKSWVAYTWSEYVQRISEVAGALKSLGVKKESPVAILSSTRAEWSYCDHAILGIGGVTVPIYQTTTANELEYILNNSEAELLFIENKVHLDLWHQVKENCPMVKKVIGFPGILKGVDLSWKDFLDHRGDYSLTDFKAECQERTLDDIATIIYTSGTTGTPKGVVLTHEQIVTEIIDTFSAIEVTPEDLSLSFLPYAHVLGRIESWGHAYRGFQMAYAESFERIKHNIQSLRPTIMMAVPRIFEKIHSRILSQAEANWTKRKLFEWAIDIGRQVSEKKSKHQRVPLSLIPKYLAAKRLVLDSISEALGGRLRLAVCGGAPLAKEVAEFFDSVGLLILEGYGMTETTGAITVNRPYDYEFGTVGRPLGETKIRLAEDGEILVQGKTIMREYHKLPQETENVIRDGWLHTGDIGEWTTDGRLKLTDRKKDLIKTAGGKYVAPQKIEKLLSQYPLISHVLIHGESRKYIVALLTLDPSHLREFAVKKNISYNNLAQLTQHDLVTKEVRNYIREMNSQLANFETIKKYKILPHEFTIESGELTPSLKVRRKFCDQKYSDILNELYMN